MDLGEITNTEERFLGTLFRNFSVQFFRAPSARKAIPKLLSMFIVVEKIAPPPASARKSDLKMMCGPQTSQMINVV